MTRPAAPAESPDGLRPTESPDGLRPYETPPLTSEQRRRLRRTGITFISICIALELAVGIGSLGDLRALSTPTGVAKLWVRAAAARDCAALLDLMLDEAPSDRAGRPGATYCDAQEARFRGVVVTAVHRSGDIGEAGSAKTVIVEVDQRGAAGASEMISIATRRLHGRWHVITVDAGSGAPTATGP